MEYLRCKKTFTDMKIWIRDYAPTTLSEVVGNTDVRDVLMKYVATGRLPNILLTGAHGTSKRTFARLTAKDYLGEDYPRGCLSIDGAINRGKDVIANHASKKVTEKHALTTQNVLSFAKTRITLAERRKKIVIIYNFEDMTTEAQNALRRIIETYESTTRFILICNNLDNIIEAIQSRCVPLVTRILTHEESTDLISALRARNGLPDICPNVVKIITMLSSGDMKKIINYVQTISTTEDVTLETFHKIFNVPPIKLLEQILQDNQSVSTQPKVLERLTFLLEQGYAYGDILEMLSKILAYDEILPDEIRFKYLERLSVYYCQMAPQTPPVHLYALFSEFAEISNSIHRK